MKFALVNGEKSEATKGAKGLCPSCRAELIARCGEVKINHWAHKGKRNCDPWWENETEWHRAWKNEFPTAWQEVVHYDENGEKHFTDTQPPRGARNVEEFKGYEHVKPPLIIKIRDRSIDFFKWIKGKLFKKKKDKKKKTKKA